MKNYRIDVSNPSVLTMPPMDFNRLVDVLGSMHVGSVYTITYRIDYADALDKSVRNQHTLIKVVQKGVRTMSDYYNRSDVKDAIEYGLIKAPTHKAQKGWKHPEEDDPQFGKASHALWIDDPDEPSSSGARATRVVLYPNTFDYNAKYYLDGQPMDRDDLIATGLMSADFVDPSLKVKRAEERRKKKGLPPGEPIINPKTGKEVPKPPFFSCYYYNILDIEGGEF